MAAADWAACTPAPRCGAVMRTVRAVTNRVGVILVVVVLVQFGTPALVALISLPFLVIVLLVWVIISGARTERVSEALLAARRSRTLDPDHTGPSRGARKPASGRAP